MKKGNDGKTNQFPLCLDVPEHTVIVHGGTDKNRTRNRAGEEKSRSIIQSSVVKLSSRKHGGFFFC